MDMRSTLKSLFSFAVVVVGVQVCFSTYSVAEDPKFPSPAERDKWMAVKLTSAQQIFAHLTNGDMEALQSSARRMQVMNILEQWRTETEFVKKSEYQGQLNAFEFATKELIRHAGDNNVDGALKAYLSMSQSCVKCHLLIRDGQEK